MAKEKPTAFGFTSKQLKILGDMEDKLNQREYIGGKDGHVDILGKPQKQAILEFMLARL